MWQRLISGAPKDGFLPNALKTHFRLSRVLLDLYRCILSGDLKFVSVRLFEIARASIAISRKFQTQFRDLSEISRGGGGWKQREGHNFLRLQKREGREKWAVKRGRVMQICVRDHVEVHPQKKKEVLYFVKKTWEKQESRVISCQNQSRTLNAVI